MSAVQAEIQNFLGAKRSDAAKNELKIIELLALNGAATVEELTKAMAKEASHWGVIAERVKSLKRKGFIRVMEQKKKRQGPGVKTYYVLTFRGIAVFFASLFLQHVDAPTYMKQPMKKTIETYVNSHEIFQNWEFLERTFSEEGMNAYDFMGIAAVSTMRTSGPPPRFPPRIEEEEEWCIQNFSLIFLHILHDWLEEEAPKKILQGTPSMSFLNFMKKILWEEKKERIQALKEIEKMEKRLSDQFKI